MSLHHAPYPVPEQTPIAPRNVAPRNVAARIALTSALISLLILPILLGPMALVSGIVGWAQAPECAGQGKKAALAGIVIGSITTLISLVGILVALGGA